MLRAVAFCARAYVKFKSSGTVYIEAKAKASFNYFFIAMDSDCSYVTNCPTQYYVLTAPCLFNWMFERIVIYFSKLVAITLRMQLILTMNHCEMV